MDDEMYVNSERETDRIARKLSEAIINSHEYGYYRQCLDALKNEPELYNKVNDLRKRNFTLQNNGAGRISYEEFTSISTETKALRQSHVVDDFLNSEVEISRMIQDITREIMSGIYFDNEFLK